MQLGITIPCKVLIPELTLSLHELLANYNPLFPFDTSISLDIPSPAPFLKFLYLTRLDQNAKNIQIELLSLTHLRLKGRDTSAKPLFFPTSPRHLTETLSAKDNGTSSATEHTEGGVLDQWSRTE